jgi:hypothetical protein
VNERLRYPEEADAITKKVLSENPGRLIRQESLYHCDGSGVSIRITDVQLPEQHPHHVLYSGFIPDDQLTLGLHTLIDNDE